MKGSAGDAASPHTSRWPHSKHPISRPGSAPSVWVAAATALLVGCLVAAHATLAPSGDTANPITRSRPAAADEASAGEITVPDYPTGQSSALLGSAVTSGDSAQPGNTGPVATASAGPPARPPQWAALGPSLLSRDEGAAAAVGTAIYVVGGFIGASTTNQVERYDTRADRWQLVAPLPVTLNHPSVVAYAGQLYVLGGYTNGFSNPGVPTGGLADASPIFLRYNPDTNRWESMPDMPVARAAAAAAVIGDKLYMAGGRTRLPTYLTSDGLLNRLDIFDFTTGRWSRGPDMTIAREHIAGAAAAGAFYVLGGRLAFDQAAGAIASVERYLPTQRRWEKVADMRVEHNGFGACAIGDQIVVFGGEEPATPQLHLDNPVTERFDPATGHWSDLPNMLTPRGALAAAAVGQRVYAIGGIADPPTTFGLGTNIVEALDLPSTPPIPVSTR